MQTILQYGHIKCIDGGCAKSPYKQAGKYGYFNTVFLVAEIVIVMDYGGDFGGGAASPTNE